MVHVLRPQATGYVLTLDNKGLPEEPSVVRQSSYMPLPELEQD